jgi:hypothetical protein
MDRRVLVHGRAGGFFVSAVLRRPHAAEYHGRQQPRSTSTSTGTIAGTTAHGRLPASNRAARPVRRLPCHAAGHHGRAGGGVVNNTISHELPGTIVIRGVQVRKQREGDLMRFTATGSAGTMVTTCQARIAWKIISLLVDAASDNKCPHCKRITSHVHAPR